MTQPSPSKTTCAPTWPGTTETAWSSATCPPPMESSPRVRRARGNQYGASCSGSTPGCSTAARRQTAADRGGHTPVPALRIRSTLPDHSSEVQCPQSTRPSCRCAPSVRRHRQTTCDDSSGSVRSRCALGRSFRCSFNSFWSITAQCVSSSKPSLNQPPPYSRPSKPRGRQATRAELARPIAVFPSSRREQTPFACGYLSSFHPQILRKTPNLE